MSTPDLVFGTDLRCGLDLDPLMRSTSGLAVVSEAATRRLTSPTGSLLADPLYGYDVRLLLNESGSSAQVAQIGKARVRAQLMRDERVAAVDFTEATFIPSRKLLTIAATVSTIAGDFSLVLTLTPDAIDVVVGGL